MRDVGWPMTAGPLNERWTKMARLQRSNFQPRRSARKFEWFGGVSSLGFGPVVVPASTSVLIASLDTRTTDHPGPFTIMRVRGFFSVYSDQNTIVERPSGAFGICIVNGEAFDAGVGSIPTPWSESFDDRWLYHTYWASNIEENPTTSDYQYNFFNHVIDGKGMRKMNHGDVLVSVIENQTSTGAIATMNFRTGAKLH